MHLVDIILVIIIIGYISCEDIISQSYCNVDGHQNTDKDCYNTTNNSFHICYLNNSHEMSSIPKIKLNDGKYLNNMDTKIYYHYLTINDDYDETINMIIAIMIGICDCCDGSDESTASNIVSNGKSRSI